MCGIAGIVRSDGAPVDRELLARMNEAIHHRGPDEDGFYFNDAGNNPQTAGETLSFRHAGIANWWTLGAGSKRNLPGGAVIGNFGGTALFVKWPKCYDLVNAPASSYPNELLCGPGFRK